MYLGQCMQMQSDYTSDHKNVIVPFRQCKLTELLFSNSFPSASASHHQDRPERSPTPQKALMVVTADPAGDFNATSQILRYSALAREITVPRIPSITSTILATQPYAGSSTRPGSSSSSHVGNQSQASDEILAEITRLTDAFEVVAMELEAEKARREAMEQSLISAEERMVLLEEEVREECYASFAETLQLEKRRWEAAWMADKETGEERMDRKIDMLEKTMGTIQIYEDLPSSEEVQPSQETLVDTERAEELEKENDGLRMKIAELEKEKSEKLVIRTPSGTGKKQRVLKAKKWEAESIFGSP
jgi:hypothetical protein